VYKPAARAERREAHAAFSQAAKAMRRRVRAVAMVVSVPAHTDRAQRILDRSGLFLSRLEIEQMAHEVADDYCGAA
jgi:hypothetical protein